MADTNTPNILLLVADPNDVINYTSHIGNNLTTIDSLMGAVDCLSTARPSNTYKGQIVYERDSGRYAQNTGSKSSAAWTYMSHSALTATSSARPSSGLTTSLLAWESDTTGLVAYNGSGWTRLTYRALPVTSSTRPSGTAVSSGSLIWESDTTRFLVYNGSSWEQLSFCNFVCTSSAHPASPFQGMEIYETDTGNVSVWSGSAWEVVVKTGAWTTTFTPTWAQSGGSPALGNGSVVTKWTRSGRMITVQYRYAFGSTTNFGTGTNPWTFTVPVTAAAPAANQQTVGSWSSLTNGLFYTGTVYMDSTGKISLFVNSSSQSLNPTNPNTWNSSSTLSMSFSYESSS